MGRYSKDVLNKCNKPSKITIAQMRGADYAVALAIAEVVCNKQLESTDIERAFELTKEILKLKPTLPSEVQVLNHT